MKNYIIFLTLIILNSLFNSCGEEKEFNEVMSKKESFFNRIKSLTEERKKILKELSEEISIQTKSDLGKEKRILLIDKGIENEKNTKIAIDSFKYFLNNNDYLKKKQTDLSNYNKFFSITTKLYVLDIKTLEIIKTYFLTYDEKYYNDYLIYSDSTQIYLENYKLVVKEIFGYDL